MLEAACVLPTDWDRWLAQRGASAGFCQTSAWARINETTNGVKPLWLGVTRNGELRAGALFGIQTQSSHLGRGLRSLFGQVLRGRDERSLVCYEGPVLAHDGQGEAPALLTGLLSQIEAWARENDIRHIRFGGPPPLASWIESAAVADVFAQFGYEMTDWRTALVDLAPDEPTLRGNLKHAARKGIKKCVEAGLHVRRCETHDEFMHQFCAAYHENNSSDDAGAVSRRNEKFWHADAERHYRFFVAEDGDGTVLATLGTYAYNGVATEIMSRRTVASNASNIPAQDLLHWEVMLTHKAVGDRWFNLAGYSPAPATDKEAGIRRFKEKWGGIERRVPQFARRREPAPVRIARKLLSRSHR